LLGQPDKQKQHDYLYWSFYERGAGQAVRIGDWKLVEQPLYSPIRLYNLASDIGEERDTAAQHAELVAKLTTVMKSAYVPNENWKLPDQAAAEKGK